LIKVLADRRFNKRKEEGEKLYIYLVPEMVCLTGLTDEERTNFNVMKSLGRYTKLTAKERMKETSEILNQLQGEEDLMFNINEQPKLLNGYKYPTPHIILNKANGKEANARGGNINLK
jgi:aubergine